MYNEHGSRVEEGVAVLSKFPIRRQDYILLSRDYTDKQDDHQRLVLHAQIAVPSIGTVHVYGTHLSLSEAARDRTVLELSDFIDLNGANEFPVFCGDLNAEPDSAAIRYLIVGTEKSVHRRGKESSAEREPITKMRSCRCIQSQNRDLRAKERARRR